MLGVQYHDNDSTAGCVKRKLYRKFMSQHIVLSDCIIVNYATDALPGSTICGCVINSALTAMYVGLVNTCIYV